MCLRKKKPAKNVDLWVYIKELDVVPGSWIQYGSVAMVTAIWEVNQLVKDLFIYVPASLTDSAFQVYFKK